LSGSRETNKGVREGTHRLDKLGREKKGEGRWSCTKRSTQTREEEEICERKESSASK